MTPYEVAMLATALCKLDRDWKQNLPASVGSREPEEFLDEAIDLLRKTQTYLLKKNLI